MNNFNMAWGNSICIRQAFVEAMNPIVVLFNINDFRDMGYTEHNGDPELIEATRAVLERQTGIRYEHIVLTNGATGGIVVALTALRNNTSIGDCVYTSPAPFFRMYPDIIKNAGLDHLQTEHFSKHESGIVLLDNPSNPKGTLYHGDHGISKYGRHILIFDSVYFTKSFIGKHMPAPPIHDINVGSYSKMTGLNGVRVGFCATNNPLIYERLKQAVGSHYCGLSHAQNTITKQLIKNVDWDLFENLAQKKLDDNRTEWSKLEKYFDDTPVYPIGMFFWSTADKACKDLLDSARVTYFPGSKLHATDDFIRINLGQDCQLVKDAVKAVLAEDKI